MIKFLLLNMYACTYLIGLLSNLFMIIMRDRIARRTINGLNGFPLWFINWGLFKSYKPGWLTAYKFTFTFFSSKLKMWGTKLAYDLEETV